MAAEPRHPIILYDLAGRASVRFSPNCWRTRMALLHKGLPHETCPTRFLEIPKILRGSQKTVPVIDDNSMIVGDSWAIANYLEDTYPDHPSLFGGAGGRAFTPFIQSWCISTLHAGIISLILLDIHDTLDPEDQVFFRATREKRFGKTLEEFQAGRETRVLEFRKNLGPLRATLSSQRFLGGDTPLYADYVAFGPFQWARTVSLFSLLEIHDPIHAWRERCLDLFGGIARREAADIQSNTVSL